jgi:hypothetical protein
LGPVFAGFSVGLGPFSPLVARLERDLVLWLWRRDRARRGTPVTERRRRNSGRAYAFETRRSSHNGA